MTRSESRFFRVAQEKLKTSAGEAPFPILYYDATALLTFFWCELEAAQSFLDDTGLQATRFLNGRALAAIGWYEYRDTDIGAYNEVGVAIAVQPENRALRLPIMQFFYPAGRRTLGFYIIDLPVTTEIACAAGREMWGFPKFVAEIPLQFEKGSVSAAVLAPEKQEPIVSMNGRLGAGIPLPGMDLVLYSNKDDRLLRTEVITSGWLRTSPGNGLRVETGPGTHPMADNLRRLGLNGASPFSCQLTHRFRSRLYLGDEVC